VTFLKAKETISDSGALKLISLLPTILAEVLKIFTEMVGC
jgi:hypothetical protein